MTGWTRKTAESTIKGVGDKGFIHKGFKGKQRDVNEGGGRDSHNVRQSRTFSMNHNPCYIEKNIFLIHFSYKSRRQQY